jgi:signal transduction histidine kinase
MESNKRPLKVLLIDDDEDDYLIISRLFDKIPKTGFELEWVSSIHSARSRMAEDKHDIYLVDYRLGSVTGLELLSEFDLPSRRQPFIILTGAGDKTIEISAMKAGVADYLVKGKFDAELLTRVLYYSVQRKLMELQRVQELIEINESKDEFISLASHQLRTPATAVKQYIGMILQGFVGNVDPKQKDFLEKAYTSNERQLDIINDILRVARLDLKKLKLNYQDINVRDMIDEIANDLAPEYKIKRQTLVKNYLEENVVVNGDYTYLSTAISNIIDNASKYSYPDSTVTVSVNRNGHDCVITIEDDGVGIDMKAADRLFEKFSRISNPLSIEANGTGLGLYWSKEVVNLHGGSISVESELDNGSVFTIRLRCL